MHKNQIPDPFESSVRVTRKSRSTSVRLSLCALAFIACSVKVPVNDAFPKPGTADARATHLYAISTAGVSSIDINSLQNAPTKVVDCTDCYDGIMTKGRLVVASVSRVSVLDAKNYRWEARASVPGGIIKLAADPAGNIYAISRNPAGVVHFNLDDRIEARSIDLKGAPSGISIAPNGNVAVAVPDGIRIYSEGLGKYIQSISLGAKDTDIAYAPNGSLNAISGMAQTFAIFEPDGNLKRKIAVKVKPYSKVIIGGNGSVFVIDDEQRPCEKPGNILEFRPGDLSLSNVYPNVMRVRSAAVAKNGDLYDAEEDCLADGPDYRLNVYRAKATEAAMRFTGLGKIFKVFLFP